MSNNLNPLLEIQLNKLSGVQRQMLADRIAKKQAGIIASGNIGSKQFMRQKGMLGRLNAQGATGHGAPNASGKFLYQPKFMDRMSADQRSRWLKAKQGLDPSFRNYVEDGINLERDIKNFRS